MDLIPGVSKVVSYWNKEPAHLSQLGKMDSSLEFVDFVPIGNRTHHGLMGPLKYLPECLVPVILVAAQVFCGCSL